MYAKTNTESQNHVDNQMCKEAAIVREQISIVIITGSAY